jgi:hypothetical protein
VVSDRRDHFLPRWPHGSTLDDPTIGDIASAHGKTAAQVMLRWGLQHGRSVIPKSTKPTQIADNIDVFDFELSNDDMAALDGLDTGRRGGPAGGPVPVGAAKYVQALGGRLEVRAVFGEESVIVCREPCDGRGWLG